MLNFTVTHLCGHSQRYAQDCTNVQPLAVLRAQPCPRCRAVPFSARFVDLVVGVVENDHFIEDAARTLAEDGRVVRTRMAGTEYLCFPKLWPHSIAVKRWEAGKVGPTYQVLYRARG